MIEINLLPSKKRLITSGINFSLLNIKYMLVALAYFFLLRPVYEEFWKREEEQKNSELDVYRNTLARVSETAKKLRGLQDELESMQQQEEMLRKKMEAVNSIVKNKKNPMSIMLYVSKNIPEDVWLNRVAISEGKWEAEGEAYSYKSIGVFIDKLKESIFFGREVKFDDARTITNDQTGKRTEYFKISAQIERYD